MVIYRNIVLIYIISSLLLANFVLVQFIGFNFTPPFFLPLFIVLFKFKIYRIEVLSLSFLVVWPFVGFFVNLFFGTEVYLDEYIKSYALYLYFLLFVFIGASVQIDYRFYRKLNKGIICFLFIVMGYGLLQAWLSFNGNHILYNVFGDYLIGGVSDVGRFLSPFGYLRPTAFYYEPSFFALVVFSCFVCLALLNFKNLGKLLVLNFLAQVVIGSTLALIMSVLLFLVLFVKVLRNRFLLFLSFFLLVVVSVFVIDTRIDEFYRPGTSGYYRLMVPLDFYLKNIHIYTFGLPLGHLPYPFDNSFVNILIYSGVLGFILLFGVMTYVFRLILLRQSQRKFLFVLSILAIAFFNGALFTPEVSFMIFLIIISYRDNGFENG